MNVASKRFGGLGALYHTPSLANISPRCKSETNNGRGLMAFGGDYQPKGIEEENQKIQYLESQVEVKEKGKK